MDGLPSPAGGSDSPAPDSCPVSPAALDSKEPGEHADSPLRKRPRLDSGVDQDEPAAGAAVAMASQPQPGSPSSPDRTVAASESSPQSPSLPSRSNTSGPLPPPPLTPSKVTLNLRSADTSPVAAPPAPGPVPSSSIPRDSTDAASARSSASTNSTEPMQVVVDAPSPSDRSPVVEIIAESEEADPFAGMISDDGVSLDARLLDSFPFASEHGLCEAAVMIADSFAKHPLDVELLESVSQWIDQTWLKNVHHIRRDLHTLYLDSLDFWTNLANIYWKFLTRKVQFANLGRGVTSESAMRQLERFFQPYIRLCAHLAAVDTQVLQELPPAAEDLPELISPRHIRNLNCLFRVWNQTTLFKLLWDPFRVPAEQIQRDLAIDSLTADTESILQVVELAKVITSNVALAAKLFQEVDFAVCTIRHVSQFLKDHWLSGDKVEFSAHYASFSRSCLDLVRTLQQLLLESPAKQNGFGPDLSFRLLDFAAWILQDIAEVDHLAAWSVVKDEFGDLQNVTDREAARLVFSCLHLRVCWRFVAKGRMELRVSGVQNLSSHLVSVWREFSPVGSKFEYRPFLIVAQWIVSQKLVEYLVSVDSHPQLIARSQDIAGFVMVTHQWTPDVTKAVWDAVDANPDPRMIAEILDMLAKIVHLAAPSVVSAFCDRILTLQFLSLTTAMHHFLDKFKSPLAEILGAPTTQQNDSDRSKPLFVFIRIICEASGQLNVHAVGSYAIINSLHSMALGSLQQLSKAADDYEGRKEIYVECFEAVRQRSPQSMGRLEAMLALLDAHEAQDLPWLLSGMDLLQLLSEDICAYIREAKNEHSESAWLSPLNPRLKLLAKLISCGPAASLPPDIERELWNHLVGQDAFNDAMRDHAWSFLVSIVRGCRVEDPLIDRCVNEFILDLPPALFTRGMFDFVQESMQYTQRVNPPPSPVEEQAICIPLVDLLWRVVLGAPENTIEHSASILLSRYHLDIPLIRKGPSSSVAATHTALMERCIDQLKLASTDKPRVSHSSPPTLAGSSPASLVKFDGVSEEQFFRRTLQFMRCFIHEVRNRPEFRAQENQPSSPASDSGTIKHIKGEPLTIQYQAFEHGAEKKVKELKVGSLMTIGELAELLKQKTGFVEFRAFHSGGPFDMVEQSNKTVGSIHMRGLLLIQNSGARKDSSVSVTSSTSASVAERALLNHIDTIYDLLDLDESLSLSLYEFLLEFPPHNRIRDLVLSEDNKLDELFPQGNRIKTLYSLRCIIRHLPRQFAGGVESEQYTLKGVHVLTCALTSSHLAPSTSGPNLDVDVLALLVECLLILLKQRPLQQSMENCIANDAAAAKELFVLLEYAKAQSGSKPPLDCSKIYACLLEASFHSERIWQAFVNHPRIGALHLWLLLENTDSDQRQAVRISIESICTNSPGHEATTNGAIISFFWLIIESIIPKALTSPLRSREVLATAKALFPDNQSLCHDETALRNLFDSWTTLLSTYEHADEGPQGHRDEFVLGLGRLLSSCVSFLKSFKKPIKGRELMEILFMRYLFPSTASELVEEAAIERGTGSPLLCADTRRELYSLVLAICEEQQSYDWLVQQVLSLLRSDDKEPSFWNHDITRWMRPANGYSGLRNLTNTCYMNSLLTQLFMNTTFRNFILSIPVSEPKGSQKLLFETQRLLANMRDSNKRYADTWAFAESIQPYDADHIDISIQMDVDEFYNLLFDRWEAQMLSPEAKQHFRSLYGGQLVTQIKSKDCEHVSETVEPFMSIQCEVRGKSNLTESLHAYVQGDAMEGDNKYKCESCGGRFVNAIKRCCIQTLPENLIFHLKRFDFDLTTLNRHKINDEFSFPEQIDMRPFGVSFVNDPTSVSEPDIFELVGVLVHNGTAESGHYYSYIRLPSATTVFTMSTWAEFNDAEVSEFNPVNIPDQCFGGSTVHGDMIFPKQYNAYMLFYRRATAIQANVDADYKGSGVLPANPELETEIRRENELLSRRFCLFDPTHAHFVRALVSKLKETSRGTCSSGHELERQVCQMAVDHSCHVLSRIRDVPDLEPTISALLRMVSSCAECAMYSLILVVEQPETAHDVLLACPTSRARTIWSDFIVVLLRYIKKMDGQSYGITANSNEFDSSIADEQSDDSTTGDRLYEAGAFYRVANCLEALMPQLGRFIRSWDDFFNMWAAVIDLGISELAVLLTHGLLADMLEILYLSDSKRLTNSTRFQSVHDSMLRQKRPIPRVGLVKAIYSFLIHAETSGDIDANDDNGTRLENYNSATRRFPLMQQELQYVHHLDHKNQLSFLSRILDGWETATDADGCVPAQIVDQILQCALSDRDGLFSREIVRNVGSSLAAILSEYNTQYTKATLTSCLVFCQACFDAREALPIIEEAVISVETMKDQKREPMRNASGAYVDFGPQGGANYLDFFHKLCEMGNAQSAAAEGASPYTLHVISKAPRWAPPLLMFDLKTIRASTVNLLETLLFNKYPFHLSENPATGETEIYHVDLARITANRALFEACCQNVQRASQLRLPSSFIQATSAVMTQSASFCDKLCREEPVVMQQLQLRLDRYLTENNVGPSLNLADDSRKIVSKWHELEPKLKEWAYDTDGDDAISDTEWGSSFDDLSDAVTDG